MSANAKMQLKPSANILLAMVMCYPQRCFAAKDQNLEPQIYFRSVINYNILSLDVKNFIKLKTLLKGQMVV